MCCSTKIHECGFNLCADCQANLPSLPKSCETCGRFLAIDHTQSLQLTCGVCLTSPPPYDKTYALFPYETPITKMIYALKFQHQLNYANTFGKLLLKKIQYDWYKNQSLPDLIIPVPLHSNRIRERGFNQSLEIAKQIAKSTGIPIDTKQIVRIKNTLAQSGLNAQQRKQNLSKAFVIKNHKPYQQLTIALMDDVMTTGSTMHTLAQIVRANGAKSIHLWCCARRG